MLENTLAQLLNEIFRLTVQNQQYLAKIQELEKKVADESEG